MSLSDKIIPELVIGGTKSKDMWIHKEDVEEFIKTITEASDENDFDIMIEDGEDGNITISFSEFIKRQAGKDLIEEKEK